MQTIYVHPLILQSSHRLGFIISISQKRKLRPRGVTELAPSRNMGLGKSRPLACFKPPRTEADLVSGTIVGGRLQIAGSPLSAGPQRVEKRLSHQIQISELRD